MFALLAQHRQTTLLIQLRRWLTARPSLHTGACPYARRIIEEMIDSRKTHLIIIGHTAGDEILELFELLLNDLPPNLDPPSAGRMSIY